MFEGPGTTRALSYHLPTQEREIPITGAQANTSWHVTSLHPYEPIIRPERNHRPGHWTLLSAYLMTL